MKKTERVASVTELAIRGNPKNYMNRIANINLRLYPHKYTIIIDKQTVGGFWPDSNPLCMERMKAMLEIISIIVTVISIAVTLYSIYTAIDAK